MLPDRRGNNPHRSLRNIVRDPRIALLFLIPRCGPDTSHQWSSSDQHRPRALNRSRWKALCRAASSSSPRKVSTQCPKALVRSRLWDASLHRQAACQQRHDHEVLRGFDGDTYDTDATAAPRKRISTDPKRPASTFGKATRQPCGHWHGRGTGWSQAVMMVCLVILRCIGDSDLAILSSSFVRIDG